MKKLFLKSGDKLSTLKEEHFEKELVLQKLLEKHLELIPSDEIIGNPSFLMVQRELPVSTGFIDIFLLDQMMVPTVIETKVNNPEIRRKIIGQGYEYLTSLSLEFNGKQIVDYAKKYWRDQYENVIKTKLEVDKLNEKQIEANLRKPRLRLIFAADFIPRELRKFVEFINNASRGIDVYAVQIEQFVLDDKKILSVTTFGPTENAIHDKSLSFGILSREEFINKINKSPDLTIPVKQLGIERINEILDIAEEKSLPISWGTKSFKISYQDKDSNLKKILEIYHYGTVYVIYTPMVNRIEFEGKVYEQFDNALDLNKSYLKNESQFKAGKRSLFSLNSEQYQIFVETLKLLGNHSAG